MNRGFTSGEEGGEGRRFTGEKFTAQYTWEWGGGGLLVVPIGHRGAVSAASCEIDRYQLVRTVELHS